MALNIFPTSPLPTMTREFDWNESQVFFDSGESQSVTPYTRPLFRYNIPFRNFNELKQSSIDYFFRVQQKGGVTPFLIKDPYHFRVNSVLAVSTNQTQGGTLQLFDVDSHFIRVDTTTIGSMTSNLSGYVRLGVEYNYDRDNGVLTVNTIAATDFWTVQSAQYFRKVKLVGKYAEDSRLWNIFNANLQFREVN